MKLKVFENSKRMIKQLPCTTVGQLEEYILAARELCLVTTFVMPLWRRRSNQYPEGLAGRG
jgi:hypothetical protein